MILVFPDSFIVTPMLAIYNFIDPNEHSEPVDVNEISFNTISCNGQNQNNDPWVDYVEAFHNQVLTQGTQLSGKRVYVLQDTIATYLV